MDSPAKGAPDQDDSAQVAISIINIPLIPDIPQGRIEIIPAPDGWQATLSTGATGTAPSPTGAILAAFASELEAEFRKGEESSTLAGRSD